MTSNDDRAITSGGGGSGVQIGGDIGGTNAVPQVTGAHFGGSSGNFFVNRAGLWVPSTIGLGDLPAIPSIANTGQSLGINAAGSLSSVAAAATLGTLQANVTSQFLNGNNLRGYIEVTVSAVQVAANADIAVVNFSAALPSAAFILVVPSRVLNAQFGDTVGTNSPIQGSSYAYHPQAANTPPSSFNIRCTQSLTATLAFSFMYFVML